jgi:pimeloyl-ACP methyl ester carboxylesterase
MLALRRGFDHRAVTSAVQQLRTPDPAWWDRLERISAPSLLITGGPRSHVSPQRLAEAAQAIRHSRLVAIPLGHRVHSLSPQRFGTVVLPFLTAGAWPDGPSDD